MQKWTGQSNWRGKKDITFYYNYPFYSLHNNTFINYFDNKLHDTKIKT